MPGNDAAMRALRISRLPRSSRRFVLPTTLPALPPKIRPPDCPTPMIWPPEPWRCATSTSSIRGRSTPRRRSPSPLNAKPRRSASTAASRIPKELASRPSNRISTPPTRAASVPAMRVHATRSRSRRSPRCRARAATTCSAMPGTPRCARPANWPRRRRSAATPLSARFRAWARARSRPAKCRCSTNRRSLRVCSALMCRRPAVARSIASPRSSKAVSASRSSPIISTCARILMCSAAREARPSTTKAW